jgi:signal transduction histidine kinase
MAGVMVRRTGDAMAQVERLNRELARQVAEREAEFHVVYERLREAEHQQVREAERRRITRDMHDGLGSQLVQTLNLVRHAGQALDQATVERMLHHALEDLRLTLDSLEPMEGDLPTILGTLRQRLAPALAAAGIELDWQVQEVPAVAGLEAQGVMHLFRCLQEVFANVVKHAGARQVAVRTWDEAGKVCLSITDDGIGFDEPPDRPLAGAGRGIRNIRLRVAELGGEVLFDGAKPGTSVVFRFAARAPAGAGS